MAKWEIVSRSMVFSDLSDVHSDFSDFWSGLDLQKQGFRVRGVAKTTFSTEAEKTAIFTSIGHPSGWIRVTFWCLWGTLGTLFLIFEGPGDRLEI